MKQFMTLNRTLLTTLFLIFFNISFSQNINQLEAKNIAINFLKVNEDSFDELVYYGNNNDTSIYIFNLADNNGFVIVPSYNTDKTILGYCTNKKFEINFIPPALLDLINNYSMEVELSKRSQDDDNFKKQNDKIFNKQGGSVQPLIDTKWDQACFYNDSCPNAPNAGAYYCQKVPTGCVSIALAQIIRFHKYPLIGSGSNSYYTPYYGVQYANFGSSFYNYSAMPNFLLSKNSATAQFIYHCAVSVNTIFNYLSSGANINDAKNAFLNYFNYSNSLQLVHKINYTNSGWLDLLKNELDSTRPVFLSGYNQNNSGGHAFVCDGYDNNNLFHINWGWGGMYNGYFSLTSLTPNSNNFSYNQSALIKIIPQNNYPVCHFKADSTVIEKNKQVKFKDMSSGNISQWKWNFEGGIPNVSYLKNPIVTYNQPGIYKVTLIVSNSNGSDTLTKNDYITVTPLANFNSNKTQIAKFENILFKDISIFTDSVISYQWIFQNGTPSTSNLKSPIVTYNQSGTFNVSLTIFTNYESNSITKSNYITVYNQCNYLFKDSIPNYYINPLNSTNFQIFQEDFDSLTPYYSGHSTKWNIFKQAISPGDTNFFYGAASIFTNAGQANNWLEFGPLSIPSNGAILKWKHLYYLNNKRDGYEVLISTLGLTRDFFISPPIFSRLDNDPQTEGNTTWTTQQAIIPSNIYGNNEIYIAFHHFANNMYYLFLDDIELINCSGLPVICDFKADTTNILIDGYVNFTDLSSGNPIAWEWTFMGGQPNVSHEKHPQNIKYTNAGVYPVKLKVFNGENADSITKSGYIHVIASGIEDKLILNKIRIFPNPAKNYINIISTPSNYDIRVIFKDIQGKNLYETIIQSGDKELYLPINHLNNGCYLIKLENNTTQTFIYKKLIILK